MTACKAFLATLLFDLGVLLSSLSGACQWTASKGLGPSSLMAERSTMVVGDVDLQMVVDDRSGNHSENCVGWMSKRTM